MVDGKGTIQAEGQQMIVDQQSHKLITNWESFNVGAQEGVTFRQPDQNAIALNRVIGNEGSSILGRIDANGQVFLVNPNGVLFGQGAQVTWAAWSPRPWTSATRTSRRIATCSAATRLRTSSTRARSQPPRAAPWS